MKRKTNLFYTDGPDSKFLTFSNYTESLTGNFLSTDTKIYPSTFLCLYINDLDKVDLIKNYLIAEYENKLAFLRDKCIEEDKKPEDHLLPLAYLLEVLKSYDENLEINYVGDITEQDYNGTYTDTICIVDFAKYYKASIINNTLVTKEYYTYGSTKLYGWEDKLDNTEFGILERPGNFSYCFESDLSELNVVKCDDTTLKFNIVIPLFDLTNINYKSLAYSEIDNNVENNQNINLQFNDDYKPTQKYVPLGIWFADKTIELSKDINTGFSETWSLVISSQFKPFPYANASVSNTDITTNSNAFPTFAMTLSKQNEILENFSKMNNIMGDFQNQINDIRKTIDNSAYETNIDKLKREFINFEYEMTNKFNAFKQEVLQTLDNLKWNATK